MEKENFQPYGNILDMVYTPSSFDIIISTATAHHLPYGWLLEFAKDKLRPGGKLIILGLAKPDSITDYIVWGFAAIPNIIMNLIKNGRVHKDDPHTSDIWRKHGEHDSYMTIREVRILAAQHISDAKVGDGMNHARSLAPLTDFLDVSYVGDCDAYAPDGFPCSPAVYGAMCIKKELPDMPVFGVHNINSKEDAINALNTGIDIIDIGKASLVDPGFAGHIINDEPYGQCLHCKNYCRWNPNEMANPDLKCPGREKFQKDMK